MSNIIGHSNLMTTAIYLHVNSDVKRAALDRGAEVLNLFSFPLS